MFSVVIGTIIYLFVAIFIHFVIAPIIYIAYYNLNHEELYQTFKNKKHYYYCFFFPFVAIYLSIVIFIDCMANGIDVDHSAYIKWLYRKFYEK